MKCQGEKPLLDSVGVLFDPCPHPGKSGLHLSDVAVYADAFEGSASVGKKPSEKDGGSVPMVLGDFEGVGAVGIDCQHEGQPGTVLINKAVVVAGEWCVVGDKLIQNVLKIVLRDSDADLHPAIRFECPSQRFKADRVRVGPPGCGRVGIGEQEAIEETAIQEQWVRKFGQDFGLHVGNYIRGAIAHVSGLAGAP